MRIVKQTNPPTMAVIIDTVIHNQLTFFISPSDPVFTRIDTVWANKGAVGIVNGSSSTVPAPPPTPSGARLLALITVHPSVSCITDENIRELP